MSQWQWMDDDEFIDIAHDEYPIILNSLSHGNRFSLPTAVWGKVCSTFNIHPYKRRYVLETEMYEYFLTNDKRRCLIADIAMVFEARVQ